MNVTVENFVLEEHGFFDLTEMIQPAVYALVYRGVVVYIGKSMMPVSRIYFHRNQRHKYVKGTGLRPYGKR